ncbi:lipoprotein [Neisseria gonorrhoeae]|uniref:Lipoprotein n=1 Tax=Neisseria gonorrhoeae TaxID=485 RepID=A0A378VXQ1_NEIGO|nr:lipoprotein [Neisseria gonorrhoeae]
MSRKAETPNIQTKEFNHEQTFVTALSALALSACAGTWQGAKQDTARNLDKHRPPPNAPPNKQATPSKRLGQNQRSRQKGGNAVGRGISHLGKKSKTPPNNRFAMPSETVSDGIVSTRRKPMKAFTKSPPSSPRSTAATSIPMPSSPNNF